MIFFLFLLKPCIVLLSLQSSHPNKGSLVKSLREAATTLSQIEQPLVTETVSKKQALKLLEAELKPLKKSIIKHDLLKNR